MPKASRPSRAERIARQQDSQRRHHETNLRIPLPGSSRPPNRSNHHARNSREPPIHGGSRNGYTMAEEDGNLPYRQSRGHRGREAENNAWKAIQGEQARRGPPSKRARTGNAGASNARAAFDSRDTPRTYEEQSSEEGEVNEENYPEVRTGEIPPYPVRRPYHLGAMGRFGVDIPLHSFTPVNPDREPKLEDKAGSKAQPYSRVSFGSDEFIRLDDGVDDEEEDDEDHEEFQKHIDFQPGSSTPATSPPDKPPGPGREYRFNFGQYSGDRFDEVLNSNVDYIKTLGGQSSLLDRFGGKLRAAFEYHCPQYIKQRTGPIEKHPKDYKFDFGKFGGSRFDQTPDNYLRMLEGQVLAGKMDARKGLREAYEWHWWGGKEEAQRG